MVLLRIEYSKIGHRIATMDGWADIAAADSALGDECNMVSTSVHVELHDVWFDLGLAFRLAIALLCRWIGKV